MYCSKNSKMSSGSSQSRRALRPKKRGHKVSPGDEADLISDDMEMDEKKNNK